VPQEQLRAPCANLRQIDFLAPLRDQIKIEQMTVVHTPLDKLTDAFVTILAGAHGLVEVNTRLRSDLALQQAFGRTSCADQSTIQDTLNACTEVTVPFTGRRFLRPNRHDSVGNVQPFPLGDELCAVWSLYQIANGCSMCCNDCIPPPPEVGGPCGGFYGAHAAVFRARCSPNNTETDVNTYGPPPEPITPTWLTDILRMSGALTNGAVLTLDITPTDAFNSRTKQLLVTYTPGATGALPARLILKQPIDEAWAREAGADEVRFYQLAAALDPRPPAIVPCYAAALDVDSSDSYLLLHDVSATHRHPVTREQQIGLTQSVPSDDDIAHVTEALARHHAYWWNHSVLLSGSFVVGYWSRDAERFRLYGERRLAAWGRLLANQSGGLPRDVQQLYTDVLDRLERHWARFLEPRFRTFSNLSLVHGDAFFPNFLTPQPGADGATYLIDWQSPAVDIAGYDLVNLLATFWTREQRHEAQREHRILEHYHRTLVASGVEGYSWDDLVLDYRAGLIFWLLMPVQDGGDGAPRSYWWPKMQCLIAAWEDWQCAELLR
jgi:thiamine kinase-like enzyme